MPRRVSLPTAEDLFRPTVVPDGAEVEVAEDDGDPAAVTGTEPAGRRPSGRVRHEEKMTVYVTSEELLDIEQARLTLRREHGLALDRGRVVRAAVAMALADLDAQGAESPLVRRLVER